MMMIESDYCRNGSLASTSVALQSSCHLEQDRPCRDRLIPVLQRSQARRLVDDGDW